MSKIVKGILHQGKPGDQEHLAKFGKAVLRLIDGDSESPRHDTLTVNGIRDAAVIHELGVFETGKGCGFRVLQAGVRQGEPGDPQGEEFVARLHLLAMKSKAGQLVGQRVQVKFRFADVATVKPGRLIIVKADGIEIHETHPGVPHPYPTRISWRQIVDIELYEGR